MGVRQTGRNGATCEPNGFGERVSYYDGDSWSSHVLNEIKCAECGEEFDQQEKEGGNICPACIDKESESENE